MTVFFVAVEKCLSPERWRYRHLHRVHRFRLLTWCPGRRDQDRDELSGAELQRLDVQHVGYVLLAGLVLGRLDQPAGEEPVPV